MIGNKELQSKYNDMCAELRNYIWDFDTVDALADVEIEVYTTFPDILKLRNKFNQLFNDIRDVYRDDEDLRKSVDAFKNFIESDDSTWARIKQVREVIQE